MGKATPWEVPSPDNNLELIELTHRAREFLLLDVHEHQRNLVASVAQSFSDALFPPEDPNGPPLVWIRGVLRNSTCWLCHVCRSNGTTKGSLALAIVGR
jgi:hypothetical protein